LKSESVDAIQKLEQAIRQPQGPIVATTQFADMISSSLPLLGIERWARATWTFIWANIVSNH
jgi:hypothetical protein